MKKGCSEWKRRGESVAKGREGGRSLVNLRKADESAVKVREGENSVVNGRERNGSDEIVVNEGCWRPKRNKRSTPHSQLTPYNSRSPGARGAQEIERGLRSRHIADNLQGCNASGADRANSST
jgi:hypothetical protein